MTRCSSIRLHALLVILGGVGAFASTTAASWPTQSDTPLPVGPADQSADVEHEIASDGATWLAWIDALCLGAVRVQRIAASGTVLAEGGVALPSAVKLCGTTDVMLHTAPDGSAIVRGGGESTDGPVYRIAPDGSSMWGAGGLTITEWIGGLGAILGLDGGDVMLGGYQGMSMFVTRRGLDGSAVWTTEIPTPMGPNKRVLGLVPDDAGGAFLLWDVPLTYTRLIAAAHVTGAGVPTWTEPLIVVPIDPSSSRHTDPVVMADGSGGVVIVFTKGTEAANTPVPLLMQRFDRSGTLAFDVQGARVSLGTERQYDAVVHRDAATNDLVIAWRSGPFGDQELRAQRMTLAGTRLWGDTGVSVAELGPQGSSYFDAAWDGTILAGVVSVPSAAEPTVRVQRVDGTGALAPATIAVSGETDALMVTADAGGDVVTLSWFERSAGVNGDLVAQRLNADGTLGVNPADLDGDGDVDFADLLAMLGQWGVCPLPCAADLDGDGAVGFSDVLLLIAAW